MNEASKAPVFIIGCHRSGTSFLYHSILSSGDFAIYRCDTGIWDRLIPLFGDLADLNNRKRMMNCWFRSKMFRRTGLKAEQIMPKILAQCKSGGDFLRIVMEEMASLQNVSRWAAWSPDNIFHIPAIKREIPDALFIHIIRDGRDVATALDKKGWIKPFPWVGQNSLLVAGVHWEWMVRAGLKNAKMVSPDYIEVRYEDLVLNPRDTFTKIGNFIRHDLDYDRIRQAGIGAVTDPNSTFKSEFQEGKFNPVGRWKNKLSHSQVSTLESVIGPTLDELCYPRASDINSLSPKSAMLGSLYLSYFKLKLWLRCRTPIGRFASKQPLELI